MTIKSILAGAAVALGLSTAAFAADVKVGFVYVGPTGDHGWTYRHDICLLYTSPSPRDLSTSRMPSSA